MKHINQFSAQRKITRKRQKMKEFTTKCSWPVLIALLLLILIGLQRSIAQESSQSDEKMDQFDEFDARINKYGEFIRDKINQLKTRAFEYFQKRYKKTYTTRAELAKRAKMFFSHYDEILNWNNKYALGEVSYKLKANEMSDWTEEQLQQLNGVIIPNDWSEENASNQSMANWILKAPTEYDKWTPKQKDWRHTGCIAKVRHQGSCGSCYAFATVDMVGAMRCLESYRSELKPKMNSLRSPQQIVDCATKDELHGRRIYGCEGGWPENVLAYLERHKRLAWEAHYPYRGREGDCLTKNGGEVSKNDSTFKHVYLTSEQQFLEHLADHGPIVATMRIVHPFFYHSDGIFEHDDCEKSLDNHAVVIVGYGENLSGKKYWIIQNSWGEDWGEKGYYKLARGQETCRIGQMGWGILKN